MKRDLFELSVIGKSNRKTKYQSNTDLELIIKDFPIKSNKIPVKKHNFLSLQSNLSNNNLKTQSNKKDEPTIKSIEDKIKN